MARAISKSAQRAGCRDGLHACPQKGARLTGFTLVELLVVIGIIALLISILLPGLNKARESAKTVQCASNMRQVGQGFYLYASQQRGWLPPAVSVGWRLGGYIPNGGSSSTWVDLMLRTKNFQAGGGQFTGGLAWLNDYTVPVLNCPSNALAQYDGSWLKTWSYAVPYNIFGCDGNDGYSQPKPSKIASLNPASQVILLAEAYFSAPSFYPMVFNSEGHTDGRYGWDVRHGKRANFLMADGHVNSYTFEGKKIYGVVWCFLADWEDEVENNLYDSRAQIGIDATW